MGHPTHVRTEPRRRWWRPALLVAGVALAVLELRGHLPSPASTWSALRAARFSWLLVAVVLQTVSMGAFAEQQRHLLAGFGVRLPARRAIAVSYARSAMSTSLPGGSAISAAYAFQQYRAKGASHPIAAAVLLLSGVASVAAIVLLYAGDALSWTAVPRPVPALAAAAVAMAALAVWRVRANRPVAVRAAEAGARPPVAGQSRLGRLRHTLRETATLAAVVPPSRWFAVLALAVLNWLTDLACLLTALHAVGLAVPLRAVATAYLAAQLIRQIPVTPGGIGVIEASLILALTTAGAPAAPAAAAVLIYRLLSCWLVLPIGLICWTTLKSAARQLVPAEAVRAEPVTVCGLS